MDSYVNATCNIMNSKIGEGANINPEDKRIFNDKKLAIKLLQVIALTPLIITLTFRNLEKYNG